MILAKFYMGPYDGEFLTLPTTDPWPRFVIPKFGTITVEHFYLYSGQEHDLHFYLYEAEPF